MQTFACLSDGPTLADLDWQIVQSGLCAWDRRLMGLLPVPGRAETIRRLRIMPRVGEPGIEPAGLLRAAWSIGTGARALGRVVTNDPYLPFLSCAAIGRFEPKLTNAALRGNVHCRYRKANPVLRDLDLIC